MAAIDPASNCAKASAIGGDRPGQLFRQKLRIEDSDVYVTVLFRFADTADENTLLIINLFVRII